MKIQISNYKETEENICLTIRVEQEENNYQNSVPYNYEFNKLQYPYLSTGDDFKTLAFRLLKPIYERVFKNTGYVEETPNPIDFKITEPRLQSLELHTPENIVKYLGEDFTLQFNAVALNQFGEVIENITPQYDPGAISDSMTELQVTANYEDLSDQVTIPVQVQERPISEIQMLGKMVSDLMMISAEKDETISVMGHQITNLMLK